MKRYCQTLMLKNDQHLIDQYIKEHQNIWPEIKVGIKEVGILDMQIYLKDNLLFMIVETVDEFDWIEDNKRLAGLPKQVEWENYVAKFQQGEQGIASHEKWQLMTKIFDLNK